MSDLEAPKGPRAQAAVAGVSLVVLKRRECGGNLSVAVDLGRAGRSSTSDFQSV